MKSISELFDTLLTHSYYYPVTLWNIVFRPSSAFSGHGKNRRCPPGFTFCYSMILLYISINLYSERFFDDMPKWLNNPGMLFGIAVLLASLVVNLQRVVITKSVNPALTIDDQLKYLFYPISVYMVMHAPLPLFLNIAEMKLKFRNEIIASLIQDLVACIVYFAALYNLARYKLAISPRLSPKITGKCFLIFLLGTGVYGYFLDRGILFK